jgi:hypothetical protein
MRQSLLLLPLSLLLVGREADAQKKNVKPASAVSQTVEAAPMIAEQFMDKLLADESQMQKVTEIHKEFLTRAQDIISSMEMQPDVKEAAIKEIYEKRFNDYLELLNDDGKKELMKSRKSSALFDLNSMRQLLGINSTQAADVFASEMRFMIKGLETEQTGDFTSESFWNQRKEIYGRRIAAIRSLLTPEQTEKLKVLEAAGSQKKEIPAKGKQSATKKG